MQKKSKKIIILGIFIFFLFLILALFLITPPRPSKITWAADFSIKHSINMGLDWKENYSAILDDLRVKKLRVSTYWDLLEPERDQCNFADLDWQIAQAKDRNVNILLVVGMKTPRWPECHIPAWASGLSKEDQQTRILILLEKIVSRYSDSKNPNSISAWQVENEPFFSFGECLWSDEEFLKREVNLVRNMDVQKRPVVITDSGEGSSWIKAAKIGDIVGTTMYRKVWFKQYSRYISYPFSPLFYWLKSQFIENVYKKKVVVAELQTEPWCPDLLYDCSMTEQNKTMNLEKFKNMIAFAQKTGFDEYYLWGSEWWYWLKTRQNDSRIWNEARQLFEQ